MARMLRLLFVALIRSVGLAVCSFWKILRCGNNLQSWRSTIPSHDSPLPTDCFGLLCDDCGRDGEGFYSLSNQTPFCAGAGL